MTKTAQTVIDETASVLMKTYAPQAIVIERGEGCYAFDSDGRKYVDFACGIAVASLGHAPPAVLKTINEQAAKLMALQSSYATLPKLEAARLLVDHSCFDLVYFCNSGTESVEAALKLVHKWAYDEKGPDCNEIIAFRNSFHGRTYGAASITEKRHAQPFFEPYLPGIRFAQFNDLDSVKALAGDKTAAIVVEPVQGEGGLAPADPAFMKGLRALCDEKNIALVFDEVQAGMGRLGTLFAYENFGVEPDVGCYAKGLGSGFPVGAMLAKTRFGKAFVPGTHGTTYGGNPLACAVAATVLKEMLKPGFMEHVRKTGAYLMNGLKQLQRESNKITDVRGLGLMIGIDTTVEIGKFLKALQKNGLLATQAGKATLRLTPALIAQEKQIDEAIEVLAKTLREED